MNLMSQCIPGTKDSKVQLNINQEEKTTSLQVIMR